MICPEQTAKRSQHLPDFQKIVFKIEKWRVDLEQKRKLSTSLLPLCFFHSCLFDSFIDLSFVFIEKEIRHN